MSKIIKCEHRWIIDTHQNTMYCSKGCEGFKEVPLKFPPPQYSYEYEIEKLLIDCANFIQPYDDGGNEAERLMVRLDEAINK